MIKNTPSSSSQIALQSAAAGIAARRGWTVRIVAKIILSAISPLLWVCCCQQLVAEAPSEFPPADLEFFEASVRPLLVEKCYACHGPEELEPKGKLRLDSRTAILAGGESGPAVDPTDWKQSLLLQAIRYEGLEMPPDSKLTEEEIRILEKWVSLGAPWSPQTDNATSSASIAEKFDIHARREAHWCWKPIQPYAPPHVLNATWPRDPLDHFILAKMEAVQIHPAADASRFEWHRRVTFDLTGLPPTPSEIRAFASDQDADAYEKVVDRLLASPRFGEHWARHWLDLVRYAETCGHEFDYPIPYATRYRDYVIRALNGDVPWDQFFREHIAGDLLPNPRINPVTGWNESLIGTGFWYLGEATHGPVDVRANEAGMIDNRIDVLGKTFLGLTLACARCHDHKFDAISAEDFYSLSGMLKSTRRVEGLLDPAGEIAKSSAKIDRLLEKLPTAPRQSSPEIWSPYLRAATEFLAGNELSIADHAAANHLDAILLKKWTKALRQKDLLSPQHPLHLWNDIIMSPKDDRVAAMKRLCDTFPAQADSNDVSHPTSEIRFHDFPKTSWEGWFATGAAFGSGPTSRSLTRSINRRWESDRLADSGCYGDRFQGILQSPTFPLTSTKIHVWACGKDCKLRVIIDGYDMDRYNAVIFSGLIQEAQDDAEFRWVTLGGDLGRYRGERAYLEIDDSSSAGSIRIGQIVFSDEDPPMARSALSRELIRQVGIRSAELTNENLPQLLTDAYAELDDETFFAWMIENELYAREGDGVEVQRAWREQWDRLSAEMQQAESVVPPPARCQATRDGTRVEDSVHIRGNPQSLGTVVPLRSLQALGATPYGTKSSSGRLELADQLVSLEHPLTARVAVNRIWHHLFGRGIVASTDNFGVMGDLPTHPELLDYLAHEWMQDGWSLKGMVRRITLSSTYRQSSLPTSQRPEADPQNRLLHHFRIKRISGEALRDTILFVTGDLNLEPPESSVPVYLTSFMSGRGRPEKSGPLDGDGRRSIYLEVRRNFLSPWMLAMDTPIPFNTVGRRNVSNVPAQALLLLNDPFVLQQCNHWATRFVLENTDQELPSRLPDVYFAFFGRPMESNEGLELLRFVAGQEQLYRSELNLTADEIKRLVWRDACHVLINCKEFVFVK
jgi:Protein of unknown function (DUF1549)/Protein of unknown function (DUF1553)/Planctomycete cytochrome C